MSSQSKTCTNVIRTEELINEVSLTERNIADDVFGVRDPMHAAFLKCRGFTMTAIRLFRISYSSQPNRHERVVEFVFKGHEDCMRLAINAQFDRRSSLNVQNINFGEFYDYIRDFRTTIKSFF